jgi:predicted phosphodiesterase
MALRFLGRAVAIAVYCAFAGLLACIVIGRTAGWGSTAAIIAYAFVAVLVLIFVAYWQLMKRSATLYQRAIASRFDEVFRGKHLLEETLPLEEIKLVVLSDQHKGGRDGADDFWRCERAYRAALAYYQERGYRLIVLGDAEELWESSPEVVLEDYAGVLELEQEFHLDGRLERVWGNHDIDWRQPRKVRRWLAPIFGPELVVREGLKLEVTQAGKRLGLIFMTHGHQGTPDSDVFAPISRPVVFAFGIAQAHFKRPWNTPAGDWKLRARHDEAMKRWAEGRRGERVVLIAGHTHRPVFWDRRPAPPDEDRILKLERQLEEPRPAPGTLRRAALEAELEYLRGDQLWTPDPPDKLKYPCYFNTGCCAFGDGDATGIEIEGGEIRLVRWPDNDSKPLPEVLAKERLEVVFEALG